MRLRLSERSWLALAACLAVLLFEVANRGAYQSFFSDDDLDNLGWTAIVGWDVFQRGFLTPLFALDNFRPAGHVFYRWMQQAVGLDFARWIGVLHVIHFANVAMVYLLARGVGARTVGAAAGAAFFLFHPALFAAFWRPMYIFDVQCASFLLVATLLWLRDRWVLAFVAFWLAYKAKEVALFYPVVLALLEAAGSRRWWRVVPFFAVSLSFGGQALVANRGRDSDYSLRFTAQAIAKCVAFYLRPLLPWLAAALVLGRRDRRVWLTLAAFAVLMGPLWFLPGRLFAVYLYVPMVALAVGVAFLAERFPAAWVGAAVAAWFGFVYFAELRDYRKGELTIARENRIYFERACVKLPGVEPRGVAFYEGGPPTMAAHGVEGALHRCYSPEVRLIALNPQRPNWQAEAPAGTPVLSWNSATRQMRLIRDEENARMNVFRLESGWHALTGGLRWSEENAAAMLTQPPGTDEFFVTAQPTVEQTKPVALVIEVDGAWIGDARLDRAGPWERGWPVPRVTAPVKRRVTFRVSPAYRVPGDPRTYGIPFADFGYRARVLR